VTCKSQQEKKKKQKATHPPKYSRLIQKSPHQILNRSINQSREATFPSCFRPRGPSGLVETSFVGARCEPPVCRPHHYIVSSPLVLSNFVVPPSGRGLDGVVSGPVNSRCRWGPNSRVAAPRCYPMPYPPICVPCVGRVTGESTAANVGSLLPPRLHDPVMQHLTAAEPITSLPHALPAFSQHIDL
jgi:hypothetical protein